MRRAYLRLTRVSGSVILPGYVGLSLVAPEMTIFLFGRRWAEAGPVAAVLFLIGPVLSMQAFSGSLLTAAGYPSVVLRFRLLTTVTNIIGFVIAVQFGILWVAVAYSARGYLLLPLNLAWQRRYGGIPTREYLAQLRGTALATIVMTVVVLALKFGLKELIPNVALLFTEVAAGFVTVVVALRLLDRHLLSEMLLVARQSVPGAGPMARLVGRRRSAAKANDSLAPPLGGDE
jgi:O-antigen/teichoic acid export membrane protein